MGQGGEQVSGDEPLPGRVDASMAPADDDGPCVEPERYPNCGSYQLCPGHADNGIGISPDEVAPLGVTDVDPDGICGQPSPPPPASSPQDTGPCIRRPHEGGHRTAYGRQWTEHAAEPPAGYTAEDVEACTAAVLRAYDVAPDDAPVRGMRSTLVEAVLADLARRGRLAPPGAALRMVGPGAFEVRQGRLVTPDGEVLIPPSEPWSLPAHHDAPPTWLAQRGEVRIVDDPPPAPRGGQGLPLADALGVHDFGGRPPMAPMVWHHDDALGWILRQDAASRSRRELWLVEQEMKARANGLIADFLIAMTDGVTPSGDPAWLGPIHDAVIELRRITDDPEHHHPDAVAHAAAALTRLAGRWLTEEQVTELYLLGRGHPFEPIVAGYQLPEGEAEIRSIAVDTDEAGQFVRVEVVVRTPDGKVHVVATQDDPDEREPDTAEPAGVIPPGVRVIHEAELVSVDLTRDGDGRITAAATMRYPAGDRTVPAGFVIPPLIAGEVPPQATAPDKTAEVDGG